MSGRKKKSEFLYHHNANQNYCDVWIKEQIIDIHEGYKINAFKAPLELKA